jgi:SIR2-like domain
MATSPADDLTEVDLLGATLGRGALALIGAGASVASGYPSWTALLSALEIRIQALVSDQSVSPKLKVVLDKLGDPAWYAEELVRRLGQEAFHVFVQETFRAPVPPQCISQAHTLLASLPFRHYLTTNYDPCMEVALIQNKRECRPIHWNDDAHVEDFFGVLSDPRAEPCVVYLHGRFDRPADVILTETSYRIYLDDVFQRRLLAIFMTQPVVFVGFSMADPELAQLMRVVRATVGAGTARHFGIFGYHTTDERELIQRRMRDKFGVRPSSTR